MIAKTFAVVAGICGMLSAAAQPPAAHSTGLLILNSISTNAVCPGGSFDAAFSASGFTAGNAFTAQLSGPGGTYTFTDVPTVVGVLDGTASGVLHCTLPPTVAAGTYEVRLLGSRPAAVSITLPIVVNAPGGSLAYPGSPFCAVGNLVPQLATPAGGSFSGDPGLAINPLNGGIDLAASTPGAHRARYSFSGGCGAAEADLFVYPGSALAPLPDRSVCAGSPVAATPFSGNADFYEWTNSNPAIGLAASGHGTVPAFTAVNNTGAPISAVVTVTPRMRRSFAYIANNLDANVSVIDLANDSIVKKIWVGQQPKSITVRHDSSLLYVANEADNSLSVINPHTQTVVATVPLGTSPGALALSPDDGLLYVAAPADSAVLVLHTTTLAILATIHLPLNAHPAGLCLSPDGAKLYIANSGGNTVTVVATASHTISNNLLIGTTPQLNTTTAPEWITRSPDGTRLYVSLPFKGIYIVDAASETVTGSMGLGITSIIGPSAISPDGSRLYVCDRGNGQVAVFDPLTRTLVGTISMPGDLQPAGISLAPGGTRAYVTSAEYVSVLDLPRNSASAFLPATAGRPGTIISTATGSPVTLGDFFVSVPGCAGATQSFTITVNPTPTTHIGYSATPYCALAGGTALPEVTGVLGGTFSGPAGLVLDGATGAVDIAATPPGTYPVTYTPPASSACALPASTTLSIAAGPTAGISYGSPVLCANGGPRAVIRTGPAGGTYTATPAGLLLNSSTGSISPGLSQPGTYTVTYAGGLASACTAFSCATQVTITAAPNAAVAYPGNPFCTASGTVLPQVSGTPGGSWSAAPAGLAIDAVTGAIQTGSSLPGSYTVTYSVAAGGGCAPFSATTAVQVSAGAAASIGYAGGPFCPGAGSVTPLVLGTQGGSFSSTAGLVLNPATGAVNLAASQPGTYTITYTVSSGGACAGNTVSTTLVLRAGPQMVPVPNAGYCAGAATAPIVFAGADSYAWTNSDPSIGLAASGSGDLPSFNAQNGGTAPRVATISVTPTTNGCSGAPQQFTLTVAQPQGLLLHPADSLVCPGTPTPLQATGGSSYQWYRNGSSIAGGTGATLPATQTGRYTVVVSNGACTAPAAGFVTLSAPVLPPLQFTVSDTCAGSPAQFRNITAGNVQSSWSFGDGSSGSGNTVSHGYANAATYTVTLHAALAACPAVGGSLTRPVHIETVPAGLRLPDVRVRSNWPVQLQARPLAGATYSWTPAAPLTDATVRDPHLATTTNIEFTIRMTFANGCSSSDTLRVLPYYRFDIYVADAFTPNGDGRNDVLHAVPTGLSAFRLFRVYGRGGVVLFETSDPQRGWDGTFQGVNQPTATYVWVAEGTDLDGQPVTRKGTVTLIR